MDDVHAVAVVQSLQDLLEDFCGDLFREELFLDDTIEELASCAQSIFHANDKLIQQIEERRISAIVRA